MFQQAMPILIVIAMFERHFRRRERHPATRSAGEDNTPRHLRRPSMLHTLTNVNSIRLVHTMFEVDQEYRDDISLFADDREWPDSPSPYSDAHFMASPRKRTRVESEPTAFLPEFRGKKGTRAPTRPTSLVALGEDLGSGLKEELDDIKASSSP
jgi:hypothetical protein